MGTESRHESPSELDICLLALEQIDRLALVHEASQHVLLNGTRMTAARAIGLIASWARQGVCASELMIVETPLYPVARRHAC